MCIGTRLQILVAGISVALCAAVAQKPQSYLYHEACQSGEGVGGLLRYVRAAVALAQAAKLQYVCNPDEFVTVSHGTGALGMLFDCESRISASGTMVPEASVERLTWVNASALDVSTGEEASPISAGPLIFAPKTLISRLEDLRLVSKEEGPGTQVDATRPTVRWLHGCPAINTWGTTRSWFRTQFHAVRLKKQRPLPWQQVNSWKIALHVRRGDEGHSGLASLPIKHYIVALSSILAALRPLVTEAATEIFVLAEVSDVQEFKSLVRRFPNARIFAGSAAAGSGEAGQARLIHDLDVMATSDILVCSHGQFSSLGAALQADPGIALSPHDMSASVNVAKLSNVIKLGSNSEAPIQDLRWWVRSAAASKKANRAHENEAFEEG